MIYTKLIELIVCNERIKDVHMNKSTRTLWVCTKPSLAWDKTFSITQGKLITPKSELMVKNVNSHQDCTCFNTFMITSVFVGCEIVELTEKQELELMKTHKRPLFKI